MQSEDLFATALGLQDPWHVAEVQFVRDFVAAWTKVMNADRFDLA